MFKEERDESSFSWEDLGDLKEGRPNLGLLVPVALYRLLQYTMRDVMIVEFGVEKTNEILAKSGKLAGEHLCNNMLDTKLEMNDFLAELQKVLKEQMVGILRVERTDLEAMEIDLTVAEDLDCSGLPFSDETICAYDEGFIAGILKAYTGKDFNVREADCWASGERVCRFEARLAT